MTHNYPPIPSPWDEAARSKAWQLLQSEVYGPCPTAESPQVGLRTHLGPQREIIHIPFPVLCATPDTPGPWPTLVGLNFYGLYTLEDDPNLPAPSGWTYPEEASRGSQSETWPLSRITEMGWAVATTFVGDIEPDAPELSAGSAISTWAQGLQAIVRALQLDSRFDAGRMVAIGHSRLGKTALLAAACDEAFAGVVSLQSGCGGAGTSRTKVGETIKDITTRFPHWFDPKFAMYADEPDRLPLDQHWLLALCSSRPFLLCNASLDLWADPEGQHEMLQLAAEVTSVHIPEMKIGQTVGGRLAHFYRYGKHEVIREDWDAILPWIQAWFR